MYFNAPRCLCEVMQNELGLFSFFLLPGVGGEVMSYFIEHHRDAYMALELFDANDRSGEVGVGPLTNGHGPAPPFPL